MTGYKSKRAAALDEDGMYLVHHTAQPAQEPDVVMHWASHTWTTLNPPPKGSGDVNLYYAPAPQRPWVDLTDEDWEHIHDMRGTSLDNFSQGAVWAKAKLKERNA